MLRKELFDVFSKLQVLINTQYTDYIYARCYGVRKVSLSNDIFLLYYIIEKVWQANKNCNKLNPVELPAFITSEQLFSIVSKIKNEIL